MKTHPILTAFDFNEDDNGGIIVRVYDEMHGNRVLTWREFIAQESDYARRAYWFAKNKFPGLFEKSGTNDNHEKMFVVFRRFVSHWMSRTADKVSGYNFLLYTDGSIEAHIDQQTCAQNCPHLLRLQSVLNEELYTQSNHAVEFTEAQMERVSGGLTTMEELEGEQ